MPLRSVGSTQKANQRGRARKELQASLKTIRQWSLQGHLHTQVGGQSVITLPSTTTSNKGKNVGMIGEHRLLMVKATCSGQHRHSSRKAILAIPEAPTFTGNATLEKESLVAKLEAIFAYQDQPGWHDPDPNTKVVKGKKGRRVPHESMQHQGHSILTTRLGQRGSGMKSPMPGMQGVQKEMEAAA